MHIYVYNFSLLLLETTRVAGGADGAARGHHEAGARSICFFVPLYVFLYHYMYLDLTEYLYLYQESK
jgi:hypothetical protein